MASLLLHCPRCRRPDAHAVVVTHPLDSDGRCTGCGHQWPAWGDVPCVLPGLDDVGRISPELAEGGQRESLATWAQAAWGHRALPPLPHTPTDWLAGWLNDLPPGPVLVAGCATGAEAVLLASLQEEVWALDAAPLPVLWARQLADRDVPLPFRRDALRVGHRPLRLEAAERAALRRVHWVVGDLLDPPFAAASFACVVMLNVLDAVAEPLVALGQAEALLRPGGVLVASSPYHFQPAVTPDAQGLLRWLPDDRTLAEGMAGLFLGGDGPCLFDELRLERSAADVPWVVHAHPGFAANYRLHVMRLRKTA